MVYRGKPSQGCHSCRQRRIKCDQKRPGCTQCARSWQQCPGYRDKLDVLFKDESQTTARKVIDRRKQARSAHSPVKSVSDESCSSSSPSALSLPPSPTLIIEDCALGYFACVYLPSSHFDYLSPLLKQVEEGSPLARAARATALANFSAEHGDSSLLSRARFQYMEALQLTNKALSVPADAVKDETLASVLLLSLFEAFMHEGRRVFPQNWSAHIEGAAALLRLRGTQQFDTEIGSLLFSHVSANIRVSAAIRRVPLPTEFDRLYQAAMQHYSGTDHLWRLYFLKSIEDFAMARYEFDRHLVADPEEMILKLLRLDAALADDMTKLPSQCQYTVGDSVEVGEGLKLNTIHYPNARIAQLWDSARMMRIFCNEAIHRILTGTSYYGAVSIETDEIDVDEVLSDTFQNCERMCLEICGGMQNYLHPSPTAQGRIILAEASWLLWPLAVAGDCYLCEPIRKYAIEQLQLLGQDARLPQALSAAEMLRERAEDEEWYGMLIYFMDAYR